MGNDSSSRREQREQYQAEVERLEKQARKNFDKRVKSYNYAYHGPYDYYINWCHAEYELECIPESCRQGSRYR